MRRGRHPEPPLDPFERAARRVDPEYARLAEAADAVPPASLRATRLLALFAVLVGVVAVSQTGTGRDEPARSCRTPAVTVDPTGGADGTPVRWSVTGPADLQVVLGLDSPRPPAVPLAGPLPLKDCLVRGSFPLRGSEGQHALSFFLLAADGTVRQVVTRTITVG